MTCVCAAWEVTRPQLGDNRTMIDGPVQEPNTYIVHGFVVDQRPLKSPQG